MTRVTEVQIDRETESGDTEIELELSEMEKEIECEFEKGFQFIEELEWEYETNLFEESENILEWEYETNLFEDSENILEWEYETNLFEDSENILEWEYETNLFEDSENIMEFEFVDIQVVEDFEIEEELEWEYETNLFKDSENIMEFEFVDIQVMKEFEIEEELEWEYETNLFEDSENIGDTVTMLLEAKIDQRIHPHNKGQKGHGVRKKQEDFKVDLRFPPANDTPDIIMITNEEDNVFDCKDHLLNIEEELLQDLLYNEYIQSLTKTLSRNQDSQPTRGKASKVVNAPCDAAPDNFPSFPGATEKTRGPLCKPSLVSKKIQTC